LGQLHYFRGRSNISFSARGDPASRGPGPARASPAARAAMENNSCGSHYRRAATRWRIGNGSRAYAAACHRVLIDAACVCARRILAGELVGSWAVRRVVAHADLLSPIWRAAVQERPRGMTRVPGRCVEGLQVCRPRARRQLGTRVAAGARVSAVQFAYAPGTDRGRAEFRAVRVRVADPVRVRAFVGTGRTTGRGGSHRCHSRNEGKY
jgi:hypothetical protein